MLDRLRENNKRAGERRGINDEPRAVALGEETGPQPDVNMDELRVPTGLAGNS